MKGNSIFFLIFFIISSCCSLRLDTFTATLASDSPSIPTNELVSSLYPSNLRLAQVKTSYTNQPIVANRLASVNSNVAAANSKGSRINVLSTLGLVLMSLIVL